MENIDVGELLIQMFILCKTYNVKISIDIVDPNVLGPNTFHLFRHRHAHYLQSGTHQSALLPLSFPFALLHCDGTSRTDRDYYLHRIGIDCGRDCIQ